MIAMDHEQKFKDHLRATGERVTTTRLGVFRILLRHAPIAMNKLILKAQEDGIDPVTTYRTVDLFRKQALVQDLGMGRNRLLELSDSYHAHHHHFSCMGCGKIDDFDSESIEAELAKVSAATGFEIRSHQLEVTGVCAACRGAGSAA